MHQTTTMRTLSVYSVGDKVLGYKDKVFAVYFLQEKLVDINDHLTINLLIIFNHLISSFWSGGGIVPSFHTDCMYIIL